MAGVNLAAVHYHFGSKEDLIRAVFARRIAPLNAERLRLLKKATAKGKGSVERILEALIGPALRLSRNPAAGGDVFVRLMGRTVAEPSEGLQNLFSDQFGETAAKFTAALQKVLPGLPKAELQWRFHFVIGTMAHAMCDPQNMKKFTHGLCDPSDRDALAKRMVGFLSAGMRAPL